MLNEKINAIVATFSVENAGNTKPINRNTINAHNVSPAYVAIKSGRISE
jgi:hypothetical protein